MEQKKNIMDYDTVSLDDESSAVVIIDQTKLPGTTEINETGRASCSETM